MRLEGFEPPTRGLGIRGDVLHRIAESCEYCISKPFFLLRLAQYCRALRSRWCQSGLNCTASSPAQIKGRRFSLLPASSPIQGGGLCPCPPARLRRVTLPSIRRGGAPVQ